MRIRELIVAGAVLATTSCETYEFPPRLRGVGTDDCPECEALVLSETRLPRGDTAISGRFAFEDDQGALAGLTVYVTTPSGEVLQRRCGERSVTRDCEEEEEEPCEEIEPVFCDGFVCSFASDESDTVGPGVCELTAERFNRGLDRSIAARLRGYEQGVLVATFGVSLDALGEWSVEVEAERDGGEPSNRISATFEVAADVDDNPEE